MYPVLFGFFFVSVVFSFLCSMWEAVLLSISPSYMQIKLNEGTDVGDILQQFKANIDRPLAAILTLNTIAHTVGAIGVGKEAAKIWADANPLVTNLAVPVVMTGAILIFSEIIPKTIGATNWRVLAPFTVRSLNALLKILAPIIWLCQGVTRLFNTERGKSVFSRSDFLAMAQIGSEEGHLDPVEAKFIHNLLHFKNYTARQIMTPRTVVVTAPAEMTFQAFYDKQQELNFSRVPLRENRDSESITGYVLKDEVLEHLVEGDGERPLGELKRDIFVVPETYSIFNLFNDFITRREHFALVEDEFGGTSGIVTMEDVVETLLGAEIVDETDKAVDMQELAKRRSKSRRQKKSPAAETSE